MCFHLLCAGASFAQRSSGAFGPMIDFTLGYTPIRLTRSAAGSSVVVLAQESATVYSYSLGSANALEERMMFTLSRPSRDVTCAAIATREADEFAFLSRDGETVMLVQFQDSTFHEQAIELRTPSQRVTYGDFNSDGRTDVLLFGKKRAGISTLARQKNGKLVAGIVLFPDQSLSDLLCTDLNGDGITDIFVLNWLSNELGLYYGIGRGVFSEQVEVQLPGEPGDIALSGVTKAREVSIAVTVPEKNLVATFQCNSAGEIESTGDILLPTEPSHVRFSEINADNNIDIVTASEKAIFVLFGKQGKQWSSPIPFGTGRGIESIEVLDLDGDGKTDLAAVDRVGRRLVAYGNTSWSGAFRWPAVYGVGAEPKGIVVVDINRDGLPDVEVINTATSTLSVLMNRGNGVFYGQEAFSLPEEPVSVKMLRPVSNSQNILLTSHAARERIGIVTIGNDGTSASISVIPTGSNPHVVYAKRDSIGHRLEILARSGSPQAGHLSLSLFQQIDHGQFLERSLRASLPDRITALTVDDYTSSGNYRLVFVTHDRVLRQSTVSLAFASQGFDFKTVKQVLSLPDSAPSVRSIATGFVDEDSFRDVLLLMAPPRNAFGIVYGKGGGLFRDSVELIRNVQPLDEDAVLLQDVNRDGHADLTWIDVSRNAVVTAYGHGKRKFGPPVLIVPAAGVTALAVADVKTPNVLDLILVNGSKNSVNIIFHPFR